MAEVLSSTYVGRCLDELPFGRHHRRITGLIIAGVFFDLFDIGLLGSLAPDMTASKFAGMSQIAIIASSTFLGLLFGSVLQGGLTDRLGRKTVYQFNLAVYGVATLAAAFAPGYRTLAALRFVAGLGLGAEIPLAYAYAAEFAPRKSRGLVLGLVNAIGGALGLAAAVFFTLLLRDTLGWRGIFAINGVGALIVFGLRFSLPESPRWLAARGRAQEALPILRKMGVPSLPDSLPPTVDPQTLNDPFYVVFTEYTRRVLALMVAFFCAFAALYALVIWLPTLMASQGFTIARSLTFTLLITMSAPANALVLMLVIDRFGRIRLCVASFLLAGIFAVAFSRSIDSSVLLINGFFMAFFVNAAANTLVILGGEIFPTAARSTGSGLGFGAGRLGSVLASYAVLGALGAYGFNGVFVMIALVLLVGAASALLLGREPAGVSLEVMAMSDRDVRSVPLSGLSRQKGNAAMIPSKSDPLSLDDR